MVAVEAVRLADTGLPSAALSGGWRISIKAQYLDARKGSDVTAATQDWLLPLASACNFSVYLLLCGETWPNHNIQRWRLRPTNTDAAQGCWHGSSCSSCSWTWHGPAQSLSVSLDWKWRLSHPPVLGYFPVFIGFPYIFSAEGFHAPRSAPEPSRNLPRLFQTPPIAGCLKALKDCQQQLK